MLLPAFRFLVAHFLAMGLLQGTHVAVVGRSGLLVAARMAISLDVTNLPAPITLSSV